MPPRRGSLLAALLAVACVAPGEDRARHTARPAARIKVADGFRVELLHVATPGEGSWVAMCVDPRGRLIVSDQYGAGLFRVTPPPAGGDPATTLVERIDVELSGAQGLLWMDDALYVMANGDGLYRVRDTDGDDQLDDVELLRALEGGGEHGWHALVAAPDGESFYVVAGNQTRLTELASSRVPLVWGEDQLLPRLPDTGGFMVDDKAPGGCLYRVDRSGTRWELLSVGYRNPYDAAVHRSGDLLTFDADMEWDVNTPWYRPTRVCLATSGSEYGWRNGSGKWPPYHADSLPPVLEIGPGSPVGVTFGYGAAFPTRYQDALYLADWSYGRVYAAHLVPDGSAYRGEAELFMSGTPLPVTDLAVHPGDGSLYLVTGGRNVQSGLYRVRYVGEESTAPVSHETPDAGAPDTQARAARLRLETFHGRAQPGAVDAVWPFLGHPDRFLRYAARIALEWQPPSLWGERALAERVPHVAIAALTGLVRVSARDADHRSTDDPPADPALQVLVLASLARLDWEILDDTQRLELLRAYALAFTRLGPPGEDARTALVARLEPLFPSGSPRVDTELCELLVFLQAPGIARKAMDLLAVSPTQEQQIDLVKSLRLLQVGWTRDLRRAYFEWFLRADAYRGGASFAGFVRRIRDEAEALLTEAEREVLEPILTAEPTGGSPLAAMAAELAGRGMVREWRVDDLAARLEGMLQARDVERGRRMLGAVGCYACHRVAGEGGAVGPDLTGAGGRFGVRDLLEAIIEPSKTVSDLYERVLIVKTDGEVISGHIVNLDGDQVHVSTDMFRPGDVVIVDRDDVEQIRCSEISSMPTGLLDVLHEDEIADLVAFLLGVDPEP